MHTLLVDNGSIHTEKLAQLIGPETEIIAWDTLGTIDTSTFNAIVLSGSQHTPVSGNEHLFRAESDLIKSSLATIVGICFGCELIGSVFGGRLHDLGIKRRGMLDIISTDTDGLLFEEGRRFRVYEAHRWAIASVPKDFSVLARSDHGPEIIRHRHRPIWGLQFHPEHLTENTLGDEIFRRILSGSGR
jgi:para-aminobenzoate synthetase